MENDNTHSCPPSNALAMAKKEMVGYPDNSKPVFRVELESNEPQLLLNRLFSALSDVKEFQMLSMDSQGDVCVALHKLIRSK